jgi:murein DD-endopeptidase MepM/ murein hydrolase activator NlpD
MSRSRRPLFIVVIVVLVLAAAAVVVLWPYYEGQAPRVVLEPVPSHLGVRQTLVLKVSDQGLGLARVYLALRQGGTTKVLLDKDLAPPSRWARQGVEQVVERVTVVPKALGLGEGPATLVVEARDRSFASFLQGNRTRLELAVTIDTTPPRLTLLTPRIYLNRGGSGLVIYRLSPDATRHGVVVGGRRFQGYKPWAKRPDLALCYFAFADDLERGAKLTAFAMDAAGNLTQHALPVRLRWRRFRHDKIDLSDRVVQVLAARFAAQAPPQRQGDLAVFLWVNEKLREENHRQIGEICARSAPEQLWQGPFLRPQGKPMSGFGDRRTYYYYGKEVSRAVHRGVDLADVAHAPVKAAARGKVLYAAPLGIYGNCVILDHGQGVATLYGHLSSLAVKPGQEVKRGQELGRSGATGLALGDHLHFSVLVGGVFVNPAEWWDPHWVEDNLALRFGQAGLPKP